MLNQTPCSLTAVALFNAVRKQQCDDEENTGSKRSKGAVQAMSKSSFLDMLKGKETAADKPVCCG